MFPATLKVSLAFVCFCFAAAGANAQEVVHALTGTITSINPDKHTIQVKTYDESEGLFKIQAKTNIPMDFSAKVKAETTPADSFSKNGANVLMYYIGDSAERTAVAVQDLGAGPLQKNKGNVVKLNKHQHTLIIKDDAGAMDTFTLEDKTVAEGAEGVTSVDKFNIDKGDHVWVISRTDNGKMTALFVRER